MGIINSIACLLALSTCTTVPTTSKTTSTVKVTSTTTTIKTTSTTAKTTSSTAKTTALASTSKTSTTSNSLGLSSSSIILSSSSSASSSSSFNTASETYSIQPIASEIIIVPNNQSVVGGAADTVPLNTIQGSNGQTVALNTSVATNTTLVVNNNTIAVTSISSTVLVIARDYASAYTAYSGLNGYGVPYQLLLVPQNGTVLPTLNSSLSIGLFGAIIVLSEVSYDYGAAGFQSALSADQWKALYTYQVTFGVRMVRLDVYPSADSGTVALGSCCAAGQEQLMSVNDTSAFPTAGLIAGATLSTLGLYHYPAAVTNSTIATAFVQFGTTDGFANPSAAGVINNIAGREQMVFFISFATNWSPTSNYLQHTFIQWVTRGLYAGYRRINLNTQVDDMFLESSIYSPANTTFRLRTSDLNLIKAWIPKINAKLPTGSNYFMEIGHNGNGNIEMSASLDTADTLCKTSQIDGPVEYADQIDTPLEYQKPLGSGTNIWPSKPSAYPYSTACTDKDPLKAWFATAANRDVFAHISHTFTHEGEDNATYSDIFNEISWNQAWLNQTTISAAKMFSPKGLIPPAITGLHNGDALRAWSTRGLTNCVGDNTRPVLLNSQNEFWPLITTVAGNGFDGMQVNPRWATTIYYNCDTANCTVAEWIATSAGAGDISTLLALERASTARHLLGLHRDPYMFHQANLRAADVPMTVVNGVSQQLALIQMWVETVVNEITRLVTWPVISLKHDDFSQAFTDRMTRDQCNYRLSYTLDPIGKTITGVTVSSDGNTCSAVVPVTFPGPVKSTKGFVTEQVGSDPLTVWVKLTGQPVSFDLSTPLVW